MSKSATLTIRVDHSLKDRLELTAKRQQRSKSFLASAAIEEYLAVQEWQVRRISEAIEAADSGEGVPHDKVMDWVASWDTKKELPMPKA